MEQKSGNLVIFVKGLVWSQNIKQRKEAIMCKLSNWFKPTEEIPEIIIPDEKEEKYAFLTGINKYRPDLDCDLRGCVNDVEGIRHALINRFGFHPDNIRVLIDSRATQKAIIDHMEWLVLHENSILFGSYSGHGSYARDRNGDELNDNMDELLCPYDMDWDNLFIDDIIGDIFAKKPDSSRLTFLFDACHSESMSRSFFRKRNKARFLSPPRDIQFRGKDTAKGFHYKKIGDRALDLNHTILSGCEDTQTSADAYIDGKYQGAFTHYFLKYFYPTETYDNIYPDVLNDIKANRFSQTPQFNGEGLDRLILS